MSVPGATIVVAYDDDVSGAADALLAVLRGRSVTEPEIQEESAASPDDEAAA